MDHIETHPAGIKSETETPAAVDAASDLGSSADLPTARRHVAWLKGNPDAPIRLRFIPDSGETVGLTVEKAGTLDALWPHVEGFQRRGYGVFLVPAECRPDLPDGACVADRDIITTPAIYIDQDGKLLPGDWDWHAEPSFIVRRDDTHWHAYWLVDDLPVAAFKEAQRRLALKYEADQAVSNPSQVMRLAGTLHLKDPHLVTIEPRWGTEPRHTAELLVHLPHIPTKEMIAQAAPEHVVINHATMIARAIAELKDWHEERGSYRAACRLRDLAISPETAVELLQTHHRFPPKGGYESKVDHAYTYGQNQPGCKFSLASDLGKSLPAEYLGQSTADEPAHERFKLLT